MRKRMIHTKGWLIVLAGILLALSLFPAAVTAAQTQSEPESAVAENPDIIQEGDFVTVDYSLRLKSGELVVTSSKARAEDPEEKKVEWYIDPEQYGPEKLIAGKESRTPQLSSAVLGMAAGQNMSVPVTVDAGFGPVDDTLIKTYSTSRNVPRTVIVTAEEFVSQFKKFPKIGQEVNLTPYYPSKVVEIKDTSVALEAQVKDGQVVPGDFGDTRIDVDGEQVVMTLTPVKGAPFKVMGREGVISAVGKESFSVNYNHPGAGKPLVLDIEVLSFRKASTFKAKELTWVEDHDKGIAAADKKHKPMVLVLYAGWCGWSKRFLNETVKDPRIQAHWDDFVWVKVDSDKETEYHEKYHQEGYPLVVLLDSHGKVVKKLDGFKDARALLQELEQFLASPQLKG